MVSSAHPTNKSSLQSEATAIQSQVKEPPGKESVVRFAYVLPTGAHGVGASNPELPFNVHLYISNDMAHYFQTLGKEWIDDLCLADDTCSFIPK